MQTSLRRLLCAALVLLPIAAFAGTRTIITWGENTPEWNQKLGRTGMRMGCSGEPESCAKYIARAVTTQNVRRLSLSFGRDEAPPEEVQDYAAQYSAISKKIPRLTEISMDDFFAHYKRTFLQASPDALAKVIAATKSVNRQLKFGISLYEDELHEPALLKMDPQARGGVDTVYLYLHYRENAPRYESYVKQAKDLFPNAEIIAGSYALDREDYIPCSEASKKHCSDADELADYQQSIESEVKLLNQGVVQGIEFWPGNFGLEDEWDGWNNPRWCNPVRRQACIANTKRMREIAASVLAGTN